jgi:hypothetical protein
VKIMLRAAIAIFSLGIGAADAGDGDGNSVTTLFTSIRSKPATPARSAAAEPPTDAAQNDGTAVRASDARSQSPGSWLFRVFSLP